MRTGWLVNQIAPIRRPGGGNAAIGADFFCQTTCKWCNKNSLVSEAAISPRNGSAIGTDYFICFFLTRGQLLRFTGDQIEAPNLIRTGAIGSEHEFLAVSGNRTRQIRAD